MSDAWGIGTLFLGHVHAPVTDCPVIPLRGDSVRTTTMRSTTVRPAVTAGVCLVAFGFGAATIADPTDAASTAGLGVSAQLSLPVSSTLVFGVLTVLVVGLAAGVYILGDAQASDMTMGKAVPFLAGILLLGTVAAGLFLASGGDGSAAQEGLDGISDVAPDIGVAESDESADPEAGGGGSPLATIGLIGLLLLTAGGAFWYWLARDADTDPDPVDLTDGDAEEERELGEAAGGAADRIEASADDFENEVYTAWTEMVDVVDLRNPETSTPKEFAAAATDAGMDRRHVETLRDVFEEVRYGERAVTPEREERAVDALREIEAAYASDRQ